MALSAGSISRARGTTTDIRKKLNKLNEAVYTLKSYLQSNENYQKFASGTDRGQKDNENLLKTIDLLDRALTSQTTSLISHFNSFLNRQEALNRNATAGE